MITAKALKAKAMKFLLKCDVNVMYKLERSVSNEIGSAKKAATLFNGVTALPVLQAVA